MLLQQNTKSWSWTSKIIWNNKRLVASGKSCKMEVSRKVLLFNRNFCYQWCHQIIRWLPECSSAIFFSVNVTKKYQNVAARNNLILTKKVLWYLLYFCLRKDLRKILVLQRALLYTTQNNSTDCNRFLWYVNANTANQCIPKWTQFPISLELLTLFNIKMEGNKLKWEILFIPVISVITILWSSSCHHVVMHAIIKYILNWNLRDTVVSYYLLFVGRTDHVIQRLIFKLEFETGGIKY